MVKPKKPKDMPQSFFDACQAVTAKRARTVIVHIFEKDFITTEELSSLYGYDHPPRAARDVRENGIPLKTFKVTSDKTGRKIAAYQFDYSKKIAGRIGGRKVFSTHFKNDLIKKYGMRSMLNNEKVDAQYLQIDHRIPYEIMGNDAEEKLENYMLLDASSQRTKSWACEHCKNFSSKKDLNICKNCFWAYPEKYSHIAMQQERRIDISWTGEDCKVFDKLTAKAKREKQTVQSLMKKMIRDFLSTHK